MEGVGRVGEGNYKLNFSLAKLVTFMIKFSVGWMLGTTSSSVRSKPTHIKVVGFANRLERKDEREKTSKNYIEKEEILPFLWECWQKTAKFSIATLKLFKKVFKILLLMRCRKGRKTSLSVP